MPCGCEKDRYIDPEGLGWGPLLWRVLHGLAERIGSCTALFFNDERLTWTHLLTLTGEILPCELCREHYKKWIKANPIHDIKLLKGTELREFIRKWLWSLHDNIDKNLGKPSIDYTDLPILYAGINIELSFRYLKKIEKIAVQDGNVKLNSWDSFVKHYLFMASIYRLN